jgi:hypothetical protein
MNEDIADFQLPIANWSSEKFFINEAQNRQSAIGNRQLD